MYYDLSDTLYIEYLQRKYSERVYSVTWFFLNRFHSEQKNRSLDQSETKNFLKNSVVFSQKASNKA